MKYDIGTVVELTQEGKDYYNNMNHIILKPSYKTPYFVITDNNYTVMAHCKDFDSTDVYFFKLKYLRISKKYYRKQKLKQLRNEI